MRAFFLFAPAFREWPIAIARELRRRHAGTEFCGLATGPRHVFERIAAVEDLEIAPFDRLDDLERRWLATPADPARLERYETRLGAGALRRILIGDRQIGQGYVSGALSPRTALAELSREPDAARRYLTGLLDYSFARLESPRPDFVFCYAVAGAPAIALALVAQHLEIPFLRLNHTRVDARHIIDDSPQGLLAPVRRRYDQARENPAILGSRLEAARHYLRNWRNATKAPDYLDLSYRRLHEKLGYRTMAREIRLALRGAVTRALRPRPLDLRTAPPFSRMRHRLTTALRARRILSRDVFRARGDLPREPFAYYPLHIDPEASTMVLAPMQTDQIAVIEALAKSLPLAMSLVVKENLPMLGLRPPGFYDRLRRIPGVVLASPFEDGRELVERSALTAVITGTAGWEALLLQRPALVVGDAPYTAVGEGFVRCADLAALPDAVGRALATLPAADDRLATYIAAIFDLSFDFPSELFWDSPSAETVGRNPEIAEAIATRLLDAVGEQGIPHEKSGLGKAVSGGGHTQPTVPAPVARAGFTEGA